MTQFVNFKSSTPSHVWSACDILGVSRADYVSVELDVIGGSKYQLSVWDDARHSKSGFVQPKCGDGMWDHLGDMFELMGRPPKRGISRV
jgi:hypothetical protein